MTRVELSSEIQIKLMQHIGGDHMVASAAKVSTDPDSALQWALDEYKDNIAGLIGYLIKHRHGSPFEHGQLTFFADVPIFVWREWQRHRTWSFNEESGRYKELRPKAWIPRPSRKMMPVANFKPARPRFTELPNLDYYNVVSSAFETVYQDAWDHYESLLRHDIAKEVARALLPVGWYSSGWATVNPRNLMNFLSLRTHDKEANFVSYPQAEIEEAARQMEEIFTQHWPITHQKWVENGRGSL